MLVLVFDRHVTPGDIRSVELSGSPLRHAELVNSILITDMLRFVLDQDRRDAMPGMIRVGAGAALSLDGHRSALDTNLEVRSASSYSMAPLRAVYDTTTDTLYLKTDGQRAIIVGSAVTLRNDAVRIPLADIRTVLNGDLLYHGNRTLSAGDGPVLMDIPERSMLLGFRLVPATEGIRVGVFDGVDAGILATLQAGNGIVSALLVESGLVAVSGEGASTFALDSAERVSFAPINRTVLDAAPMPNPEYVAVLTGDSLLVLNATDIHSPGWVGRLVLPESAYGTIAHVDLEGVHYLAVLAPGGVKLVSVSDPANPKIVSEAVTAYGKVIQPGSTSLGDTVYVSTGPGSVCAFSPSDYAAACRDHRGGVVAMGVVRGADAPYMMSASDAPGISVRDASLDEIRFVEMDAAPHDIAGVTIHGTKYILAAAADILYVFDIYGQPVLAVPGGPYASIHVGGPAGSTYAALLGMDGAVYVVDLAGVAAVSGR